MNTRLSLTALRFTLTALAAVLVAGCAGVQWHKPGVSDAEVARDTESCRRDARQRSFQELNARVISQPYGTGLDPMGHATLAPPLAAEGDRVMIEQSLMSNCMRGLGYESVPRRR